MSKTKRAPLTARQKAELAANLNDDEIFDRYMARQNRQLDIVAANDGGPTPSALKQLAESYKIKPKATAKRRPTNAVVTAKDVMAASPPSAPAKRAPLTARQQAEVDLNASEQERFDRWFAEHTKTPQWLVDMRAAADAKAPATAERKAPRAHRARTVKPAPSSPLAVAPAVEVPRVATAATVTAQDIVAPALAAVPMRKSVSDTITVTRTELKVVAGAVGTILLLSLLRRCPCP